MNTFQKIGISCIFAASVLSCSIDERVPIPQAEGSTSLTFISDPLSQFNVGTKASDIKTEEEKLINNLHIFFFDSDGSYLTGGYLSGYPDASTEGGYYSPGQGVMTLNDSPKNAFQYCYNRNKRQSDGSIPDPGFTTRLTHHYPENEYMDENGASRYGKWFLPGIAEMEQALISYYLMFEEFQHYYYWSSSAAEEWGKTSGQQSDYARATKVISTSPVDYPYAQSGGNNGTGTPYLFNGNDYGNYDGYGGYALRSENRIRIRAFRIDLEPYQY